MNGELLLCREALKGDFTGSAVSPCGTVPAAHGQPHPALNEIKSVAVFRALQLGDLLCLVPALRALRAALPQAHITLIGLPWASDFVRRFSAYLDDFVEFPGHPALPERQVKEQAVDVFFESMRMRHFDLALQMHGSGPVVNAILATCGPGHLAAFSLSPADRLGEGTFIPWPTEGHEVHRFLQLTRSLGIPDQGDHLEFPFFDEDHAEFARVATLLPSDRPYVCVHAGARMRTRRWLPERFAEVADGLARKGYHIVLTGSRDELELVSRVEEAMTMPAINMADRTSMGGLATVLSHAALLVCNDTGVSHVATGVGVPSVVLTMGSDPLRWAPLDNELHPAIVHEVSCRPCYLDVCPVGHLCATKITAEEVLAKATALLEGRS
ncbi:MAG: Heptosyltransferase [Verrucomicrobiaceae bacterium]|nr:Heptosyltransferase [Verrucomicrobiaceae bacterium]